MNQVCRVKWGDQLSDSFNVLNGVRQGAVLSPIFFNIYIDKLLNDLESLGIGCYIQNIFYGAMCFADDLILLSPTRGVSK